MKTYPTRNGIAVPVWDIKLPESYQKKYNNHHAHYSSTQFGRFAVTQCLRDLERHQFEIPIDTHKYIHDTYGQPLLPTGEQAAKEIVDAYEKGERFKRYDHYKKQYRYDDIPQELVDTFICKYGLQRVFVMAAD